ncbi:histidine phosphatase family protein [Ponticaulis profundi]|uniref:Histidine phosphatase family protein n=1 Tax=Ponticaulis profundi TaxID=2665222 RepID=A0ABW1SDK4_9PROT
MTDSKSGQTDSDHLQEVLQISEKDGERPGPIIVSRHGKPALDRNAGPRLDWRAYKDWWARYEIGSLAEGQAAPEALKEIVKDSDVVLSSSRPRAFETATLAAPWATIEQSEMFYEANLPPPRWDGVKFLPKTWNILARAAWLRGHKLDGEGIRDAEARADAAADYLIKRAEEGKVYLAAHGWFNRMLRPRLRARGWRCRIDGGDSYWSYRVYERVK